MGDKTTNKSLGRKSTEAKMKSIIGMFKKKIKLYQPDNPMSCSLLIILGNRNNKAKNVKGAITIRNSAKSNMVDNTDNIEKPNPGNRNSFLPIRPVVFSFIFVFKVLCSGTGPYWLVVLVPGLNSRNKVKSV